MSQTQACDACRKRKVRCDMEKPCGKCSFGQVTCTYNDQVKRKTPARRSTASRSSLPIPQTSPMQYSSLPTMSESMIDQTVSPTLSTSVNSIHPWTPRPPVARLSTSASNISGVPFGLSKRPRRISSLLLRLHVKLFVSTVSSVDSFLYC